MEIEKLYDKIYENYTSYNDKQTTDSEYKQGFIDEFIYPNNGSVLDAGCGSGYTLRKLHNEGVNIFGIDFSQFCCDKYLTDLPHKCISIVDFCKTFPKYDSVICIDVLEHISLNELYDNLIWLTNITKHTLFGIANHSDIKLDKELHLTQKPIDWWIETLKKFYCEVNEMVTLYNGKFFFIECCNF